MTITVLSWLWDQPGGRARFHAGHVNIWADMVRRHCSLDIDLACVTDMPAGIDPAVRIIAPPRDFEDIRLPSWPEFRPQCLRRMAMFRRDAADIFGAERILSLDLDCVIAHSIDRIAGAREDVRFCLGTAPGRPYNGSIMLLTAGARPQVHERLTQAEAIEAGSRFVGSDQAWLAHVLPGERTFGLEDGVMMSCGFRPRDGAICFYPGEEKPWDVVRAGKDRWVIEHYRAEPASVRDGFAPVFIHKPMLEKWPYHLVDDGAQAERLARMYGHPAPAVDERREAA